MYRRHADRIARDVVHNKDADGARSFGITDLRRERACTSINDDDLPRMQDRSCRACPRSRAARSVGGGVVPVRQRAGHSRRERPELPQGGRDGRAAERYRNANEVRVRAGAGGESTCGTAWRLDR